MSDSATLFQRLRDPFPPSDVSWRIAQAGKGKNGIWAKVLAYLDNRAIMDRLDEVVGPENWHNEFTTGPQGGVLCGISIRLGEEWITKWDGAENTDIEAIKGGLSDSMKRAAVQWGIGRYLYSLGDSWAQVSDDGAHFASCKIKVSGKEEHVNFKWDHPTLPAWALPNGNGEPPTQTVAKIEKETGGKVQRATKAVKPEQPPSEPPPADIATAEQVERYHVLDKRIQAAADELTLDTIGENAKNDLKAGKITRSHCVMLGNSSQDKRKKLAVIHKQNEEWSKESEAFFDNSLRDAAGSV